MVHEVHHQRARIARIDDLLGDESLSRAEGRAHRLELAIEFLQLRFRISRAFELALVSRLDTASHRQRAPVARAASNTATASASD